MSGGRIQRCLYRGKYAFREFYCRVLSVSKTVKKRHVERIIAKARHR
jgi:hypothetical protein